jgi:dihydroneopterin aldolase
VPESRDRIQLRGLRVLGTHGVQPEEQARAQPFEVDLDVECDLRIAGRSDDLDATIDYGALSQLVHDVISGERHALLERVAERIAEVVLRDTRVVRVDVSVRKLRPPVAVDLQTAGVRITRSAMDGP